MTNTVQPRQTTGEGLAPAQAAAGPYRIFTPEQITWGPGPASMPPGAQSCVLYGDPTRGEVFAMRMKLPKGYAIPAHSHANTEIVTVISGDYSVGTGERPDHDRTTRLTAGGFFAFEAGAPHFSFADEETELQVNGMGPWTTSYVNASDDPRQGRH